MRTGTRGQLDSMLQECRRLASGLERMNADVRAFTTTARSADGSVTATVGPRGELLDLTIDATARDVEPSVLARRIVEAAGRATAQMRGRTQAVLARFLPEGVRDLLCPDGTLDAERLLPRDVLSRDVLTGGRP